VNDLEPSQSTLVLQMPTSREMEADKVFGAEKVNIKDKQARDCASERLGKFTDKIPSLTEHPIPYFAYPRPLLTSFYPSFYHLIPYEVVFGLLA
jgi:hypothetical protein